MLMKEVLQLRDSVTRLEGQRLELRQQLMMRSLDPDGAEKNRDITIAALAPLASSKKHEDELQQVRLLVFTSLFF